VPAQAMGSREAKKYFENILGYSLQFKVLIEKDAEDSSFLERYAEIEKYQNLGSVIIS
jgi:hypothetical protein